MIQSAGAVEYINYISEEGKDHPPPPPQVLEIWN